MRSWSFTGTLRPSADRARAVSVLPSVLLKVRVDPGGGVKRSRGSWSGVPLSDRLRVSLRRAPSTIRKFIVMAADKYRADLRGPPNACGPSGVTGLNQDLCRTVQPTRYAVNRS
jgi:hypothetical protein